MKKSKSWPIRPIFNSSHGRKFVKFSELRRPTDNFTTFDDVQQRCKIGKKLNKYCDKKEVQAYTKRLLNVCFM